jgi:hypothetical protein
MSHTANRFGTFTLVLLVLLLLAAPPRDFTNFNSRFQTEAGAFDAAV